MQLIREREGTDSNHVSLTALHHCFSLEAEKGHLGQEEATLSDKKGVWDLEKLSRERDSPYF